MRETVTFPSLTKNNPHYKSLLTILDALFASFVVAPLIVGFWRSAWNVMECYVYPKDMMKSAIVSAVVGYGGHGLCNFGQSVFKRVFHPDKNRLLFYIGSRFYTFVFSVVSVNGWRGPWYLLNIFLGMKQIPLLVSFALALIILIAIKGVKNLVGVPFLIVHDNVENYFDAVSMFKTPIEKKTLYIFDHLFSIYVVGTLTVFVWRGAWIITDTYLIPQDNTLSSWVSLVIGYLGAGIAYSIQPFVKWVCENSNDFFSKLLVLDIYNFFCYLCTLNIWRGLWNILNIYFLPEKPELSAWLVLWVCFIILVLLKCSNSLLVRGIVVDGDGPGGESVTFPVFYLRPLLERERAKKIEKIRKTFAEKLKMENDKPKNTVIIRNNGNNDEEIAPTINNVEKYTEKL